MTSCQVLLMLVMGVSYFSGSCCVWILPGIIHTLPLLSKDPCTEKMLIPEHRIMSDIFTLLADCGLYSV